MITAAASISRTPTPTLLAFFKSHGEPCVSSAAELQSAALALVVRGRNLLGEVTGELLVLQAQLEMTDRVSSLCVEALYAAGGFGAVTTQAAFDSDAALDVLAVELELSPSFIEPLRHLRARKIALSSGEASDPMDTFVAVQARAVADAILDWTEAYLAYAYSSADAAEGVRPVYSA